MIPSSSCAALCFYFLEAQMLLVFLHTCTQAQSTSTTCTIHPGASKNQKAAILTLLCRADGRSQFRHIYFGEEKTEQEYYVKENFTVSGV